MANFGVDCSEWLMNLVIIKPIDKEQLMVIKPKKKCKSVTAKKISIADSNWFECDTGRVHS